MSKNSSGKYCQDKKKDYEKRVMKDIKVFLKKKKKKVTIGCERYKNLPEDEK